MVPLTCSHRHCLLIPSTKLDPRTKVSRTSICVTICSMLPMLASKGIHHYWMYVGFLLYRVCFRCIVVLLFVSFSRFVFVFVLCACFSRGRKIRNWKRARPRTTTATPGSTTRPCRATRALARRGPGHESRESRARTAKGIHGNEARMLFFPGVCCGKKKEQKRIIP